MVRGVIFETDSRLTYTAQELRRSDNAEVIRIREKDDLPKMQRGPWDFVLLPIRGTADGTVELADGKADIRSFLEKLSSDALLISGVETDYERQLSCRYINFQKDRTVVRKNSEYTAEGILYLMLRETPRSIAEYTYDLLGDGNVGSAMHRLLEKLSLPHRWIVRDGGEGKLALEDWQGMIPSEVVINTIPAAVIHSCQFPEGKPDSFYIFDITSGGKGAGQKVKENPHVHYVCAPPLPGLVAPASAGHLLAELVERMMPESGRR
jgi:dipicolinate synthase subunit A